MLISWNELESILLSFIFWKNLYRTVIISYLMLGIIHHEVICAQNFLCGKVFFNYKLIFVIVIRLFRLLISS